jgi:hypothetical protein
MVDVTKMVERAGQLLTVGAQLVIVWVSYVYTTAVVSPEPVMLSRR